MNLMKDLQQRMNLAYLFVAHDLAVVRYVCSRLLVMYLGNSILALSHAAWAATLAPHYDDRSRLFGIMTGIGVLGAASILAIPIINEARSASDAGNIATMGWFIFALTPIAVAMVVWRTPEKIAPEVPVGSRRFRHHLACSTFRIPAQHPSGYPANGPEERKA